MMTKNIFLGLCAIFLIRVSALAQTDVSLEINHLLGERLFSLDRVSTNNLGHAFKTFRMEYYISQISIVHDGGMVTAIDDLYLLANASSTTTADLGNHDISSVEQVKFHIGVDEANNHADPASFPEGHPLAPRFPSMHWGWAAGYRFVAFEGWGGENFDQGIQLHGLGNNNYFEVTVDLDLTASDGEVTIALDADYNRLVEDMQLNAGLIVHGDFDEAQQALENMRDYVFSKASAITGLDEEIVEDFSIYPNPSKNGEASIALSLKSKTTYDLVVTNMLGAEISRQTVGIEGGAPKLHVNGSGVYFISIVTAGEHIAVRKWVVK